MKDGLNKVVFYFPWKEVSGGPYYLGDLANRLAENGNYEVYYVDYENTFADDFINYNIIKKIIYDEPFDFDFHEPVILVTPIYCAPNVPKLTQDSKILFVNWHNYSIHALLNIWRINSKELQAFLRMVYQTNSVMFLDKAHWDVQNMWIEPNGGYKFNENYVPLTIKIDKSYKFTPKHDNCLKLSVLGRLSKDKVYSLLNLIENINEYSSPVPIILQIIGDGNERSLLENVTADNTKIVMLGTLVGDALKEHLAFSTDILFAMGRSALEGASLGVPTVIMPHNEKPFHKNAYVFIQDTKGYSLGWYDTQLDTLIVKTHKLNEILDLILDFDTRKRLGESALEYCKIYHSSNIECFINSLSTTELSYNQFFSFAKGKGKIRVCGIPIGKLQTSFDEKCKSASIAGIKNIFAVNKRTNETKFYLFGKEQKTVHAEKENETYRLYIGKVKIPFIKI